MQCAISGQPPKEPVVSPKSGAIFERSLIESYINEHHKDPITSEDLEIDDLVQIRAHPYQAPRVPALNSVPSLLSALQNEWDSIALELFQLRKQLDDTRKELSTALYHHDAAVRVASRAIKERDEAREALNALTVSISGGVSTTNTNGTEKQEEEDISVTDSSIPQEISNAISEANQELFALHKSQKQKVNVALDVSLSNIEDDSIDSKPFKKTSHTNVIKGKIYVTSSTGITSAYDPEAKEFFKDDTIHKNVKITCIVKTNESSIVGLNNGHILINDKPIKMHKSPIVKICVHPSLDHLIISFDQSGKFSVIDTNTLTTHFIGEIGSSVITADIHTDGAIVAAAGKDGSIYIVDLRTGLVANTLASPDCTMTALKFGSNGYWLFGAYSENDKSYSIKVWDLRKENTFFIIDVSYKVNNILLDKSSQLVVGLTSGGLELAQYNKKGKEWNKKASLDVDVDEDIVDGLIVSDDEPNQLRLAIITASSAAKNLTIS